MPLHGSSWLCHSTSRLISAMPRVAVAVQCFAYAQLSFLPLALLLLIIPVLLHALRCSRISMPSYSFAYHPNVSLRLCFALLCLASRCLCFASMCFPVPFHGFSMHFRYQAGQCFSPPRSAVANWHSPFHCDILPLQALQHRVWMNGEYAAYRKRFVTQVAAR